MKFDFATSPRIIFGSGSLAEIDALVGNLGKRALVVTGSGSVPLEPLLQRLENAGIIYEQYQVTKEPNIQTIDIGVARAKAARSEFLIGYGGGAVLDAGKAIAALLTNPGNASDYLEVVGAGHKITKEPAKMIAIPTTAGTGSEVTRNAVITSTEKHVKVSMRSPMMIPCVAIVDPELTYSMPPRLTASTGMDAITQVIEAYVSNKANVMTDILAKEGIKRGAGALLTAYQNGKDQQAREDMALASLFGGLALANSGLGAVHGFAGVIGGMYDAPHGEVCASLLPHVMKYNVKILSEMDKESEYLLRYQQIAHWITQNPTASIEKSITWIDQLAKKLSIPSLKDIGIHRDEFDLIIDKTLISSSMKKNPIPLDRSTLRMILSDAY